MFSSWSRTRRGTPRPAAGGLPTLRPANLATTRCTRRAFPATSPLRIATTSSPVMHLSSEYHTHVASVLRQEDHGTSGDRPYNDFISEGGKMWDRLKAVAEANGCVPNMLGVLNTARKEGLQVFYAPHRRYRPGDYETWKYVAPIQKANSPLST